MTFNDGLNNGTADVIRVRTSAGTTIDVVSYLPGANGFPTVAACEPYNLDPNRQSDTQNDIGGNRCNASAANGGVDYDPSGNTNRGTPRSPTSNALALTNLKLP